MIFEFSESILNSKSGYFFSNFNLKSAGEFFKLEPPCYRWRCCYQQWPSSSLYQAFIGLGIFLCLGFLYGLGSWFTANQNPSLLDVKTTQEGFLEVSKILGDPRTTTHHSMNEVIPLTKDLYSSKWNRKLAGKCQNKEVLTLLQKISP